MNLATYTKLMNLKHLTNEDLDLINQTLDWTNTKMIILKNGKETVSYNLPLIVSRQDVLTLTKNLIATELIPYLKQSTLYKDSIQQNKYLDNKHKIAEKVILKRCFELYKDKYVRWFFNANTNLTTNYFYYNTTTCKFSNLNLIQLQTLLYLMRDFKLHHDKHSLNFYLNLIKNNTNDPSFIDNEEDGFYTPIIKNTLNLTKYIKNWKTKMNITIDLKDLDFENKQVEVKKDRNSEIDSEVAYSIKPFTMSLSKMKLLNEFDALCKIDSPIIQNEHHYTRNELFALLKNIAI